MFIFSFLKNEIKNHATKRTQTLSQYFLLYYIIITLYHMLNSASVCAESAYARAACKADVHLRNRTTNVNHTSTACPKEGAASLIRGCTVIVSRIGMTRRRVCKHTMHHRFCIHVASSQSTLDKRSAGSLSRF